ARAGARLWCLPSGELLRGSIGRRVSRSGGQNRLRRTELSEDECRFLAAKCIVANPDECPGGRIERQGRRNEAPVSVHGLLGVARGARRAADGQELLDGLEEVPLDSIYFHTHSYFLRHPYIAGPYPNDFANWAAIQLRDRVLGERLAVIDPSEVGDLEALRNELVTIL